MSRTQIELSEAAHNTTAVLFAAMPPQNSSSYLGSFPPPPDLIAVQNFRSIESLPVPAPALVPVSRNLRTSGSTFASNTQYPPSGTVSDHLDLRRSTERPKVAENFRSTEHAEMEAVPGRSLAHPLARVTYNPPPLISTPLCALNIPFTGTRLPKVRSIPWLASGSTSHTTCIFTGRV